MEENKTLLLFDVDGTLTPARRPIQEDMINILKTLNNKENITLGFVGGSNFHKQEEQLGREILKLFKYMFVENGLITYKDQELISEKSILDQIPEEQLQDLINECLIYIANLKIPKKRGTFVELRRGMLNISPIGRNCSNEERDNFEPFDLENNIRKDMINHLKNKFQNLNLSFSIGGQISFDIFPKGWDKTYCLNY